MPKTKKVEAAQVSLYLPPELYAKLVGLKREHKRSLNQEIILGLEEYIEQQEKEAHNGSRPTY